MHIEHNGHIAQWFTMMEGQQLLTLRGRWFSRWGRERFTFSFAYQGSQYSVYDYMEPVTLQITQDTWPTIMGALLTLIFHDWAGSTLHSILPKKVAENSFMTDCNLSAVWLPRTHDQKLLTLRWRSFSRWGREGIEIWFAYKGCQKFLYDKLQRIGGVITQDAWPEIVDAPLTL